MGVVLREINRRTTMFSRSPKKLICKNVNMHNVDKQTCMSVCNGKYALPAPGHARQTPRCANSCFSFKTLELRCTVGPGSTGHWGKIWGILLPVDVRERGIPTIAGEEDTSNVVTQVLQPETRMVDPF